MISVTQQLPRAFRGLRALVVGDAMLDSYIRGASHRICQEAPVPIVDVQQRFDMPGGAGNCAANLAAMEAKTALLTVLGDDWEGRELRRLLKAAGVEIGRTPIPPMRRTLAKVRILSDEQMVVRFDQGSTAVIGGEAEQSLLWRLDALYPNADAVIVSDYGYGVVTPAVVERLAALQAQYGKILVVDSKRLGNYRGVAMTACKPNYREAVQLLGATGAPNNGQRCNWLIERGASILQLTGARIAAVTLDGEGAVVFQDGHEPYRTFARAVPSHRAAGAGDTFLCVIALALAAGASAPMAAECASAAAALAVSKEYTATCTLEELIRRGDGQREPDERWENLPRIIQEHRENNRRIVLTNGCFDILHRGHVAYLEEARRLGDVLIVGVNTDASIRRLKGKGRPINQLSDRIEVLSALSSVDHVVAMDDDTPHRLIQAVRPDVFVKGGDYTRDTLPEAELVERLGGAIKILPFVDRQSTTGIIQRIRRCQPAQAKQRPKHRTSHVISMENSTPRALRQA
ncbi:MAG: D-glycero-beta-D-manno-heptose 1-phosphate adenylyltransferase [Planctomycetaceae bacterium]|nr:D-glycero-beta-D-manno-heptose 1-phosphate adenylyltransferase [Planctomycetaceae bacterium]